MNTDDAPRDELTTWLAALGRSLASAMETTRVEGDRVDHVIALLLSLNVPRDDLVAVLPPTVVEARRRIFGPARVPGWLDRGPSLRPERTTGAAQVPARHGNRAVAAKPTTDARKMLSGPQQVAVLDVITRWAADHPGEIASPSSVRDLLLEQGHDIHKDTVRGALYRLLDLGVVERVGRGQYAIAAPSTFEDNHPPAVSDSFGGPRPETSTHDVGASGQPSPTTRARS